jgi:hypothetical protein
MKRPCMRILCLGTLLAFLFGKSFFPAFAASASAPVHGLWVWKSPTVLGAPRGAGALRDFCLSEGVNEVYVSVPANGGPTEERQLSELIPLLHASNIRVEALFSSTDADEPGKHRDSLLSRVEGIVKFNHEHRADRFDGIHLDVEPWQRPENKGAGNLQFLPGLVDVLRAVVAKAVPAGMTVNADIAVKLLKGDLAQRQMLLSSLPRLTLMMYELSNPQDGMSAEQKADQVARTSQKDLDMAYEGLQDRNLAKMVIALRTADYVALLPQMLTKLDEANHSNPQYLGWARHSYNDTLRSTR